MRAVSVAVALILAGAIPCAARQQPCGVAPPSSAAAADAGERGYVIGPEDVLDITVWSNEALSRTVPVRPDGQISLPLLNDVQAAGLTPMELRRTVAAALDRYVPAAEVSVIVREVHSFKVAVLGEVRTPGRYELRSAATVLDLLAMAGGLSEYADAQRIVVLRQEGAATRQIPFAYGRFADRGAATNARTNLVVQRGDIIVVP
jgi:polysaccharide export outer membrane protein